MSNKVGAFTLGEFGNKFELQPLAKMDIHTSLMRKYKDMQSWWFYGLLDRYLISAISCSLHFHQRTDPTAMVGLLIASFMAVTFTVTVSIITFTANQVV